jgi:hypothetical protein
VLIIWGSQTNLPIPDERALNDWWTNEHLPERLAIPGFHRTRRYYYSSKPDTPEDGGDGNNGETVARTSHYLVVYEVESLETLISDAYMAALENPTAGTQKYMPVLASMNRSACRVLLSVTREEFSGCRQGGVGGTFAHVVLDAPSSATDRASLIEWLQGDGWEMMTDFFPSLLAMHLIEHDEAASKSGSSTKSYDNVRFQGAKNDENQTRWMLLAEFSDAFDAPYASYKEKCPALGAGLRDRGVDMASVKEEIYGLVVAMEE